jgi:hypothetical protein
MVAYPSLPDKLRPDLGDGRGQRHDSSTPSPDPATFGVEDPDGHILRAFSAS